MDKFCKLVWTAKSKPRVLPLSMEKQKHEGINGGYNEHIHELAYGPPTSISISA